MKTNIRKTLILLKISALSLFFQACGKDANTGNDLANKPTAVGQATSVNFSSRENIDMDESDIDILGQRVGIVIQKYLKNINSGENEKVKKHNKAISFNLTQDEEIIQNGDIRVECYNSDGEGKFPEIVNMFVEKPYFFNNLNLTKDTEIEVSNIIYNGNRVISFDTYITGQVIIDKQKVFNLQNFEQRIKL